MAKRLSQEEAEFKVNERCNETGYILIEPFIFIGDKTKLHLKCNKDNHEWLMNFENFIRKKHNCPKCGGKVRLSQTDVELKVNERCKEINCILSEPFIFNGSKTKLHLKCNKDNHEWLTTYSIFIYDKCGCPKCAGNIKRDSNEALLNVINKCKELNYTLLEPFIYKNKKSLIHLKCNKDNNEWFVSYHCFII